MLGTGNFRYSSPAKKLDDLEPRSLLGSRHDPPSAHDNPTSALLPITEDRIKLACAAPRRRSGA